MRVWDVVTVTTAVVGLALSVLLVLFAALRLPVFLESQRDRYPPGTNYAPVDLATNEPIDMGAWPLNQIDGSTTSGGQRILVKKQIDSRENGIWITPRESGAPWERARDFHTATQVIDGATVFVLGGEGNCEVTFALRVLSRQRDKRPGSVDVYFLPILQHLFGPTSMTGGRVLDVDERGMARWSTTSADVAPTPQLQPAIMPLVIHSVYGLWSDEKMPVEWMDNMRAWTDMHPSCVHRQWSPRECLELVRAEFSHLLGTYEGARGIVKYNIIRWLILYHEGGHFVDCDTRPQRSVTDWIAQHAVCDKAPSRMVLLTESTVSEHEAESLNRFEVRKQAPCIPGRRLATHFAASTPRHPFVHFMIGHIQQYTRVNHKPESAYETVFGSGTDALSHVYDVYGRDFHDIFVVDQASSEDVVTHDRNKSWT